VGNILGRPGIRVKIQCFVLIAHEQRHVHDPTKHLRPLVRNRSSTDLTISVSACDTAREILSEASQFGDAYDFVLPHEVGHGDWPIKLDGPRGKTHIHWKGSPLRLGRFLLVGIEAVTKERDRLACRDCANNRNFTSGAERE
jgi:hypothetical protein